MEGRERLNQYQGAAFTQVIEALLAAIAAGGGTDFKPVGTHRHLGAHACVARGRDPKGPGRGF